MARYKAILAYDGTDFCGFQRQAGRAGKRSVQGEVEEALKCVGWSGRAILAAGRTDTGVHASGQVVAFDLDWRHSTDRLLAALNAHLPSGIAVRGIDLAADDFHPRYQAVSRRYEYRLFTDPLRDPRRERFAWRVWPMVNLELMQQAALSIPGKHDFRSFGTAPRSTVSTIRTIYEAAWRVESKDLVFNIRGDAFLYRMVRRLVGVLVEIGQQKVEPAGMQALLEERIPEAVKRVAPAHGLTLVAVEYE